MANAAVKQMQQALKVYAQGTGYSAADPGAVDGVVGTRTINAVIAMVPLLPSMPDEVKALAPLGPLIMTSADARSRATTFITRHASKIHAGIVGLAAYQVAVGGQSTNTGSGTPPRWLPVGPTAQTPPVAPSSSAIFFYDRRRNVYRVAARIGLSGLGAASYVEVAPSPTRPAGTEVTRTEFMTLTGRWYATWWGVGLMVAGGAAAVGGAYAVTRR